MLFLNVLIVVLLCTSVVLIFKNQIREYLTGNANDKIITAYKNGKGEVDIPWWQKMFTDNESKIKLTDSMLGILKIDSVQIEEPIFQDVTEINLINGVATSQRTVNFRCTKCSYRRTQCARSWNKIQ